MPPHLMEEPPLLDSRSVKTPLGTSFIKTGLLILSLILSLGILELAIRLSGYDLNRDPNWRFDHQLGWVVDSEAAAIDSVQPNGFRHSPAGMRKPPRMQGHPDGQPGPDTR